MRNTQSLDHVLGAITPEDLGAASDNVLLFSRAVGQPNVSDFGYEDPMAAFARREF